MFRGWLRSMACPLIPRLWSITLSSSRMKNQKSFGIVRLRSRPRVLKVNFRLTIFSCCGRTVHLVESIFTSSQKPHHAMPLVFHVTEGAIHAHQVFLIAQMERRVATGHHRPAVSPSRLMDPVPRNSPPPPFPRTQHLVEILPGGSNPGTGHS